MYNRFRVQLDVTPETDRLQRSLAWEAPEVCEGMCACMLPSRSLYRHPLTTTKHSRFAAQLQSSPPWTSTHLAWCAGSSPHAARPTQRWAHTARAKPSRAATSHPCRPPRRLRCASSTTPAATCRHMLARPWTRSSLPWKSSSPRGRTTSKPPLAAPRAKPLHSVAYSVALRHTHLQVAAARALQRCSQWLVTPAPCPRSSSRRGTARLHRPWYRCRWRTTTLTTAARRRR